MFRIGEFSKLTQVTIRMLRYYDQTGLLKPAKIDPQTGYRLYKAEQIPVLNRIIYLRDSGFNVAEIAAVLQSQHDTLLADQLEQKYKEIAQTIQNEQEKLRKLALARHALLEGGSQIPLQIMTKAIPNYQVLSCRRTVTDYYAEGPLWQEMSAFAKRNNISPASSTFTIYHDPDYRETNVDIELCAPVEKMGQNSDGFIYRHTEPVPVMACMMVMGGFHKIAGAYQAFASWLKAHEPYQMTGQSRQIVHRGPWNENTPENYLIEIQIPLTRG